MAFAVLILVGAGLGLAGCFLYGARELIGIAANTARWYADQQARTARRRGPARSHVRRLASPPPPHLFDQELDLG